MLDHLPSLGANALTVASHTAVVVAVLLVFAACARLVSTPGGLGVVADSSYARLAFFSVLAMYLVERLYYIAARLLRDVGVNLWAAHPAPEILSAAIALAIFNFAAAIQLALSYDFDRTLARISMQALTVLALWLGIAAGLK